MSAKPPPGGPVTDKAKVPCRFCGAVDPDVTVPCMPGKSHMFGPTPKPSPRPSEAIPEECGFCAPSPCDCPTKQVWHWAKSPGGRSFCGRYETPDEARNEALTDVRANVTCADCVVVGERPAEAPPKFRRGDFVTLGETFGVVISGDPDDFGEISFAVVGAPLVAKPEQLSHVDPKPKKTRTTTTHRG